MVKIFRDPKMLGDLLCGISVSAYFFWKAYQSKSIGIQRGHILSRKNTQSVTRNCKKGLLLARGIRQLIYKKVFWKREREKLRTEDTCKHTYIYINKG